MTVLVVVVIATLRACGVPGEGHGGSCASASAGAGHDAGVSKPCPEIVSPLFIAFASFDPVLAQVAAMKNPNPWT